MGFLRFTVPETHSGASVGQFGDRAITDEASFARHPWPDPDAADVKSYLDGVRAVMPPGMKILLGAPGGIYESLVELTGFERLCLMLIDEPSLVEAICGQIGKRTVRIMERCIGHPAIGGMVVCDDWGYKTSTFLKPADLRNLIFPWHKRLVSLAHAAGKIAVLHSCGEVADVMDDVIDDLGYDAKHSFEDVICPVEQVYQDYGKRTAILGGLDVDFLTRSTPEQIYRRARALIDRTGCVRYALGSGNSITADVSPEKFDALLRAAREGF